MRKKTAKTVAAVVANGQSPFEFAVACEVFGIDRSADFGVPWYRFLVCGADPSPIRAQAGFEIVAPYGLDALRRADTIIVPVAGLEEPSAELIAALRRAHARGARLVSVCTGAFTLAATGLLDGRRATTHWYHTEEFARRFPDVKLDPGVLYVDEGDVLTSAGTAAGIDLCLHIVRLDYGAEVANMLARRMVVPPHRDGGQAQFVLAPVPAESGDDDLRATLEWASANLDRELSVDELARRAAMTSRTFARRFKQATGTTPLQWVLHQRVVAAQEALEATDLPIEMIALRCGFGSAAGLRQHFGRVVGTNPVAYRTTFRRAS